MNFDATMWLLAGFAAVVIGLSKTGVPGIGMLCVAIFANLMPAKQASGFLLPMLIVVDLVAVAAYRKHVEWVHLRRLFLWTGAGVVIGALAMRVMDNREAQVLIGGIILVLVAMHLWRKRSVTLAAPDALVAQGTWFAPVIGVLAGFTTLVANAAGPLMAIYLRSMGLPKLTFVGTSAVFFLLLHLFKVPFMAGLGLITAESLKFNALLAPAVLAGTLLGRWLLPKVSQAWFERLALGLSTAAGLKLLFG